MAREFDGDTANFITPSLVTALRPSISAWIWLDRFDNNPCVAGKWDTTGFQKSVLLEVTAAGKAQYAVNIPGIIVATGTTTLGTAQWEHVCGTFDGTDVNVYVNGALDGTTSTGPDVNVNQTGAYHIGFRADGPRSFDGKIGEVGFWGRGLRAEEVAGLAQGVSPSRVMGPQGLFSHCPLWGIDDPETDLAQATGATISGTVPAATYDGTGDYHPPVGSPWSPG